MKKSKLSQFLIYLILISALVFTVFPLYLTVISPFKTNVQIAHNFFSLPSTLYLDNIKAVICRPEYPKVVVNTVLITVFGLLGMVLILPMASYSLARNMETSKFYKYLYYFLLAGIFVPFTMKMIPMVKVISDLKLLNIPGIIIVYMASSVCEGVFLYVAYINSLPVEMEESAYIDGAGVFRTFRTIIFPLLLPMTATVLIKNGLWMWNDFLMPLLLLNKSTSNWTLTLFQYNFRSNYSIDYGLVFTAFFLSMFPILVMYGFLQKRIIGGLTAGSVKG